MAPKFVNSFRDPARQAEILSALKAVAESGNFSNGIAVLKLEQFFHKLQDRSATAFNSSGSALYTLYRYYYEQGHRHIAVPNNSFYAVGAMALEAGLTVYLVDSSAESPSMGLSALQQCLAWNRKITLVMLGHVGGWVSPEYGPIANFCMERGLVLLEDCTHVLGHPKGMLGPGKLSDASVWGFQSQGAVPVGEGGMLCTNHTELRDFARRFRQYGRYIDNGTVYYSGGMSLNMSEWGAAVACVQLKHLPEIMEARKSDAEKLQSIAPCLLPLNETNYCKYPVHPHHANKRYTTSSMYSLADQLAGALPKNPNTHIPGNLLHSSRWAQNHKCLPLGEGLYKGMEDSQIVKMLQVA